MLPAKWFWCGTCRQVLPSPKACNYHAGLCLECKQRHARLRSEKVRKDPILLAKRRSAYLMKTYNITLDTYHIMLAEQGGKCKICGALSPQTAWGELFRVDHCHKTGRIRGLLCDGCNMGLGSFRDNPSALRAAAEYLEYPVVP